MLNPVTENQSQPVFTSIAPLLFVRDIGRSCEFFTDKLGFTVDFVYGDPPHYAQLSRDNATIAVRHVDGEIFVAGIREKDELLSAAITVASTDEIERLLLTYQDLAYCSGKPCEPSRGEPGHSSLEIRTKT